MIYKGEDFKNTNKRIELKGYFNPYEYNLDNIGKKQNKENIIYELTCDIEEKAK